MTWNPERIQTELWQMMASGSLDEFRALVLAEGGAEYIEAPLVGWAADAGLEFVLEWLLQQGFDANNTYDDSGPWSQTPLYLAVLGHHKAAAKVLAAHGAVVAPPTLPRDADTCLHLAASRGDTDTLDFLLKSAQGKEALERHNELEHTPLGCAAEAGHCPAALVLLEAGADVHATAEAGRGRIIDPPLKLAVKSGHVEMAGLLLKHGANPDQPGWMGITARETVERIDQNQRDLFRRLLPPDNRR